MLDRASEEESRSSRKRGSIHHSPINTELSVYPFERNAIEANWAYVVNSAFSHSIFARERENRWKMGRHSPQRMFAPLIFDIHVVLSYTISSMLHQTSEYVTADDNFAANCTRTQSHTHGRALSPPHAGLARMAESLRGNSYM